MRFVEVLADVLRGLTSFDFLDTQVWTCDEISFLLNNSSDATSRFPICGTGADPKHVYVPVHASIHEDPINFGSSMRVSFGEPPLI